MTAVFAAVTGRMQAARRGRDGGLISADTLTGGGAALAVAPAKAAAKTRTKVVGFQMLAGRYEGDAGGFAGGRGGSDAGVCCFGSAGVLRGAGGVEGWR